jgi:hypothetical protein
MALAFKEWGYIVDALGKGKQSLIIRKGGIDEESGDFKIKGKKFLLLPTQFHQAKEMIKPEWQKELNGEKFQISQDKVSIQYFAEVADSRLVKDWNILEKLDPMHAWKKEVIAERFNRWEKSAHLLIVQIYHLKDPFELEMLPEYGGCKSWIEIDRDIDFIGTPIVYQQIKGTFWG